MKAAESSFVWHSYRNYPDLIILHVKLQFTGLWHIGLKLLCESETPLASCIFTGICSMNFICYTLCHPLRPHHQGKNSGYLEVSSN
jgi:hypothetical protein